MSDLTDKELADLAEANVSDAQCERAYAEIVRHRRALATAVERFEILVHGVANCVLVNEAPEWSIPRHQRACQSIASLTARRIASAIPPLLDDADRETLEWLKSLASAGVLVHQIDGISARHSENCRKAVALIERLQGKP